MVRFENYRGPGRTRRRWLPSDSVVKTEWDEIGSGDSEK
jgi:hypothetical protein